MPEKTEAEHKLDSDIRPENLESEDGFANRESSSILNSQSWSGRPQSFL